MDNNFPLLDQRCVLRIQANNGVPEASQDGEQHGERAQVVQSRVCESIESRHVAVKVVGAITEFLSGGTLHSDEDRRTVSADPSRRPGGVEKRRYADGLVSGLMPSLASLGAILKLRLTILPGETEVCKRTFTSWQDEQASMAS